MTETPEKRPPPKLKHFPPEAVLVIIAAWMKLRWKGIQLGIPMEACENLKPTQWRAWPNYREQVIELEETTNWRDQRKRKTKRHNPILPEQVEAISL